jgi:hypothetical protein
MMMFCSAVQLTDALNRRYSPRGSSLQHTAADYITHILAPAGGAIHIDVDELAAMGITHVMEVSRCSQHHCLGPAQRQTKSALMREAVASAGLLRLDGAACCCADALTAPPLQGLIASEMQVPASRDGASRAVFEPDALVAAIGSILADSSKAVVAEAVLAAV